MTNNRPGWCPGLGVSAMGQHPQLEALLMERLALTPALEADFRQALVLVSRWFHCLPAHPLHHNELGGALRHSLETTLYLLEFSQSFCFEDNSAADRRRQQAPLWRLSVALLGLLYDSGRLVTCLSVNDPWAGEWPALKQGLEDWLRQNGLLDYQPHWSGAQEDPREPLSRDHCYRNLSLMNALVPEPVLQSLSELPMLWSLFTDALLAHPDSKLAKTVEHARQQSINNHYCQGVGLPQLIQPDPPCAASIPAEEAVPVQIGTMTGGQVTVHLHPSPVRPVSTAQGRQELSDPVLPDDREAEKVDEPPDSQAAPDESSLPYSSVKVNVMPSEPHESMATQQPDAPAQGATVPRSQEPKAQPRKKTTAPPVLVEKTSSDWADWQALIHWIRTLDRATLTLSAGVWQVPSDAVPPEHRIAWQRRGWLQAIEHSPERLYLDKKTRRWLNKNVCQEKLDEK